MSLYLDDKELHVIVFFSVGDIVQMVLLIYMIHDSFS